MIRVLTNNFLQLKSHVTLLSLNVPNLYNITHILLEEIFSLMKLKTYYFVVRGFINEKVIMRIVMNDSSMDISS